MYSISERFEALEGRVKGIEDTLNDILRRLGGPSVDEDAAGQSVETLVSLTKSDPYSYRPLDVSRSETRILVLYSSPEEQDPIICELLHASLDHNFPQSSVYQTSTIVETFNTLSYTWGSLEKNGFVTIEGHQFPVTENLEAALRHLRNLKPASAAARPLTRSFWWIDAICINQDDVLERNQQVNLMTRIYKNAAGVHLWLGEEADNSGVAVSIARQLGDRTPRGPGELEIEYPEISASQREIHWKALAALFERPWWERVWVRQEVAVARAATVHCGNQTCTFTALTTTVDILNKLDEQLGFKPVQQETAKTSKEPATDDSLRISCYFRAYELKVSRDRNLPIFNHRFRSPTSVPSA